jgi:predicted DCC family thiol-disulfide oxidoreductase YuxK
MSRNSEALLLYDGTCGFCARSVQFVLRHEGRDRSLRFASLDGETGREIRARHPELQTVDSLIWYDPRASPTRPLRIRSDAVLTVASYLGGIWRVLSWLGRVIPRSLRDAAYDLIARHRREIGATAAESCLIPTAEQRGRFVDMQPATETIS